MSVHLCRRPRENRPRNRGTRAVGKRVWCAAIRSHHFGRVKLPPPVRLSDEEPMAAGGR